MQNYNLFVNVIIEMIKKIETSIKNIKYQDFLKNEELQDATLMRLQVIGENIKNIPPNIKKQNKKINWKKFEKLRNIISHKYASIDYFIIWNFIEKNLEELKSGILK
jgi:uncharacterized protein with HEPN domain